MFPNLFFYVQHDIIFKTRRRVEDKLDNRSLQSVRVSIRMQEGHGNRRLPLLFPAYVAVTDASTTNIFGSSKMLITEPFVLSLNEHP